jgi:hypothetical protein
MGFALGFHQFTKKGQAPLALFCQPEPVKSGFYFLPRNF